MKNLLRRTLLKLLYICAAILLSLGIIGVLLNTSIAQSLLLDWIKVHTDRTLHIADKMRVALLPHPGITLQNITLTNPSSFGESEFMHADIAEIQIKLWPLLFNKLAISRCELRGWRLNLITDQQGRQGWNASLSGSKQTRNAVDKQGFDRLLQGIAVEQLHLTQGEIIWQDKQRGTDLALKNISLTIMDDFVLGQPMKLRLNWKLPTQAAVWDIQSQVQITLDAHWLTLENLRVQAMLDSDTTRQATWQLSTLTWDRRQSLLQPTEVTFDSAPLHATITLSGHGIPENPDIIGKVSIATFDLRAWLQHWQVNVALPQQQALTQMAMYFDFHQQSDALELNHLKLQLDKSTLTSTVAIKHFAQPEINFALLLDNVDLDQYWQSSNADQPVTSIADRLLRSVSDLAALEQLKPITVNGKIEVQQLKMQTLQMQGVILQAKSVNGKLTIQPAQQSAAGT